MDYQAIIDQYYPEDTALRHILMIHSRAVMGRALAICDRHRELNLDRSFMSRTYRSRTASASRISSTRKSL